MSPDKRCATEMTGDTAESSNKRPTTDTDRGFSFQSEEEEEYLSQYPMELSLSSKLKANGPSPTWRLEGFTETPPVSLNPSCTETANI